MPQNSYEFRYPYNTASIDKFIRNDLTAPRAGA
jgi:hypothetical protein